MPMPGEVAINIMNNEKPEWLKLGEVIELARTRAGIGESKIKIMLRTDAQTDAPVVRVKVFLGCTRKRYGRVSVCRLLQIPET